MPIARYTAWNRSVNMKIMLGLGSVLILIGVASVLTGQAGNGVVPILLGSFYTGYLFLSPALSVKKQWKAAAHLSQEGIYDFDDHQFSIKRPSLQVSMTWTDIHSVVEMKEQFAIFTTKTCFFSIPKRFFAADELPQFRAFLEDTLSKSQKRLFSR